MLKKDKEIAMAVGHVERFVTQGELRRTQEAFLRGEMNPGQRELVDACLSLLIRQVRGDA